LAQIAVKMLSGNDGDDGDANDNDVDIFRLLCSKDTEEK